MSRLLQFFTLCLALILTAEITMAEVQRFGEKYGVLLSLAGNWTTASPDMNKHLGELIREKPGEYFVRQDPGNTGETQIVFIRKLAGRLPTSGKAIREFCVGQRQKRAIDACGSFSFGKRKGLHIVPSYGQQAAATYMLQLDEGVGIQFGIVSPRESFLELRQKMESALGSLQYTEQE